MGCLEYDLARYLHVDVRGLFVTPPALTWRQVIVWIRHLPTDSALARRGVLGPGAWSIRDHMLASVIDSIRLVDWHYVSAHVPDEVPPPTMIRRPGDGRLR